MSGYNYYFQRDRDRSHITLAEWQEAIRAVPGVRPAEPPKGMPLEWIGYYVNLRATDTQFHDLQDRVHDAEVFFPKLGGWRRALYWHARRSADWGVITFPAPPHAVPNEEYPVWIAAASLAERLGAELVGEDETAYER